MSGASVVVIVVAYECRATIGATLLALRSTRYRPFEVLVVDNASTDGTRHAAEELGVSLLASESNLGFAGGVNSGIEYWERERGGADIYALVNPDCVVDPGWLDGFVAELTAHPQTAVVGGRLCGSTDGVLQHAGATVGPSGLTAHIGRGSRDALAYRERAEVEYVTGALCAFRRDTWLRHGPFDRGFHPAYYEEVDFCTRCRDAGESIVFVPQSEGRHVEASVLGAGTKPYLRAYHRGRMRYLVKHRSDVRAAAAAFRSELAWLARQRRWSDVAPVLEAYRILPALLVERYRARKAEFR